MPTREQNADGRFMPLPFLCIVHRILLPSLYSSLLSLFQCEGYLKTAGQARKWNRRGTVISQIERITAQQSS